NLYAIFPETITHMRPCCQTGATYPPDSLSLLNGLSSSYQYFAHMQILRCIGGVMPDFNIIPVSGSISGFYYFACCRCHNRCSVWCSIVGAVMSFPTFLYRVKPTLGKFRRNPEVF